MAALLIDRSPLSLYRVLYISQQSSKTLSENPSGGFYVANAPKPTAPSSGQKVAFFFFRNLDQQITTIAEFELTHTGYLMDVLYIRLLSISFWVCRGYRLDIQI